MKYSILMKRFVLALALAALFCLPALAEAEITRTITNETELAAAFDEAQQLAIAATENGTVMEWMNLVVANDFELSQNVTAEDNVRIRVYSTPGQKYTIYSNQQNMTAQTALFMSVFGAELEFKDLIFDGRSTPPGSAPALLGELEQRLQKIGRGEVVDGVGRGIALDRDGNYEKIRRTYEAMVFGKGIRYCN